MNKVTYNDLNTTLTIFELERILKESELTWICRGTYKYSEVFIKGYFEDITLVIQSGDSI